MASSENASSANTILCINSGSSSLKVALYGMGSREELLLSGAAEAIGHVGRFWVRSGDRTLADSEEQFRDHGQALARMIHELPPCLPSAIALCMAGRGCRSHNA